MEILGVILILVSVFVLGFKIGQYEAIRATTEFLNSGNKITKGQKKEEEKCQEVE